MEGCIKATLGPQVKSVTRLLTFCVFVIVSFGNFFSVSCFVFYGIQPVAVKQLDKNGVQGNREFLAEVLTLSLVNHPNLVNLIGYCADGHQRILVYEYMSNGSLEDHLLGMSTNISDFLASLRQIDC